MSIIDTGYPVFSLAFSSTTGQSSSSSRHQGAAAAGNSYPPDLRLAAGSLIDSGDPKLSNCVDVYGTCSGDYDDPSRIGLLARATHSFPCTKTAFAPLSLKQSFNPGEDMLATSSDALRLYDFVEGPSRPGSGYVGAQQARSNPWQLLLKSELPPKQPNSPEYPAPLTSFSWSSVEPSSVLTASTNTTVTLWDIGQSTALTQLIAHDKEVYDVQWCPGPAAGRDQFASCGADGSVRMFDIRALEHSTILYEAPPTPASAKAAAAAGDGSSGKDGSPLLRLAFDPSNVHCLAVLHADSRSVLMIDIRMAGVPVVELKAHRNAINGMAWSGGNGETGTVPGAAESNGALTTVGDDGMVLVWDGAAAFQNASPPDPKAAGAVKSQQGGQAQQQQQQQQQATPVVREPMLAYEGPQEVNSVAWGGSAQLAGGAEYIAFTSGQSIQMLQV